MDNDTAICDVSHVYLCCIVLCSCDSDRFVCIILYLFCLAPSLFLCVVSILAFFFPLIRLSIQAHSVLLLFGICFNCCCCCCRRCICSIESILPMARLFLVCLSLVEFIIHFFIRNYLFSNPRTFFCSVIQLKTWHLPFYCLY